VSRRYISGSVDGSPATASTLTASPHRRVTASVNWSNLLIGTLNCGFTASSHVSYSAHETWVS
jgi:hypothetical protein